MSGCAEKLYKDLGHWLKSQVKENKSVSLQELSFDDYVDFQLVYGLTICGRNDPSAPVTTRA